MTNPSLSRAATLALVLALAGAGAARAASGRVSGQVTAPDGRPVEGAEVACGTARAGTDAGGLYALEGVEAGARVVVSFSRPGHATTYGAVEIAPAEDADGDGVPGAKDRCPASDLRPTVTVDGCDTGLGNGIRKGCTAMDVFLDCSGRARAPWHLLGCLAEPRFLQRVDGLTWRTLKRATACVRKATLPLAELQDPPAPASPSATLHATLLPSGVQRLDAATGGRVERDGFAVTFPPGSIDATGEVEVDLAPLDAAGPARAALPGDSLALDRSLRDVLIEPWGALQVRLTQEGRPVSLAGPAAVEMLLSASAPFRAQDLVPLWSFDVSSGLWNEQPGGDALVSEAPGGRLVAAGWLDRPGWWTVAGGIDPSCLCGRVEDARGEGVAGALVTAAGPDRRTVTATRSGGDGSYCVPSAPGARASVRASAVVGGLRLDSEAADAEAPVAAVHCAAGSCGAGPALALPDVSCVCGRTLDALGGPRPGVTVATSAGSAAASDAEGRFCLGAPARQRVVVFGEGYPPASVETGEPAACPSGCAEVDLAPPPQATCVSGKAVDETGAPIALATVEAQDALGVPYGPPVLTDALGSYSLGGLPAATTVRVRAVGAGRVGLVLVLTGSLPGEAGSDACTPVPDVVCVGPA